MSLRRLVHLGFLLFAAGAMMLVAQTASTNKIPSDFPADIPIYTNAQFRDYGPSISMNPHSDMVLILETKDSKEAVLAFYKKEFPAHGWKLTKLPPEAEDFVRATKAKRWVGVTVREMKGPNSITTIEILKPSGQ